MSVTASDIGRMVTTTSGSGIGGILVDIDDDGYALVRRFNGRDDCRIHPSRLEAFEDPIPAEEIPPCPI